MTICYMYTLYYLESEQNSNIICLHFNLQKSKCILHYSAIGPKWVNDCCSLITTLSTQLTNITMV